MLNRARLTLLLSAFLALVLLFSHVTAEADWDKTLAAARKEGKD